MEEKIKEILEAFIKYGDTGTVDRTTKQILTLLQSSQTISEEEIEQLAKEKFSKFTSSTNEQLEDNLFYVRRAAYIVGFKKALYLTQSDAVEFGNFLKCTDNGNVFYDPVNNKESHSIGFSPYDCFLDGLMSVEQLYKKFKLFKQSKQNG